MWNIKHRLKIKGWKITDHKKFNQDQFQEALSISGKVDFRPKKVTGHRKEHYILIDMSVHQDEECYGFKYKDMRIDLDYNTCNLRLQFSVCFSKIQCSHLKKYRNNNGHGLGCSNV